MELYVDMSLRHGVGTNNMSLQKQITGVSTPVQQSVLGAGRLVYSQNYIRWVPQMSTGHEVSTVYVVGFIGGRGDMDHGTYLSRSPKPVFIL